MIHDALSLTQRTNAIRDKSIFPFLKSQGFVRSTKTAMKKSIEQITWIIDFQMSSWNDKNEASFTINAGIHVSGVWKNYTGHNEAENLTTVDCICSGRIGEICGEAKDKWWTVLNELEDYHNDAIHIKDILGRLRTKVLPSLDSLSSPIEIANYLEGSCSTVSLPSPKSAAQRLSYAAILYAAAGRHEKAKKVYHQALAESKNTPIEEIVAEIDIFN